MIAEPLPIITLPEPPAALPADTYAVRHRAWWEQCDVILRNNQQNLSVWHGMLTQQISTASTAAQNARAVAEENVALAGQAAAAAQRAMVAELNAPHPAPSDAQLLRDFMHSYVAAGAQDGQIAALAKARLAEFKAATAPIFSAP